MCSSDLRGQFLLDLAAKRPQWNVLGLEIRDHFVESAIKRAKEQSLSNLHAVVANANIHLGELVEDASVGFVSINFPDPWFKKKHHKRRIVRNDVIKLFTHSLKSDGMLHVSTDVESLWESMETAILASKSFKFISNHPLWEIDYTSHWHE